MRKDLKLQVTSKATVDIQIENGLFQSSTFFSKIQEVAKSAVIITHESLKDTLGAQLLAGLNSHLIDAKMLTFPNGEAAKTRESVYKLQDQLLDLSAERSTAIIALGGGIVSDVAGFVAATYYRGVPLILVPTTFLSMVDAAIGGKTGVNTYKGKNLIGSIYQPRLILMDPKLLSTLPESEWICGLAEVVKYAVSMAPDLMDLLEKNSSEWAKKDPELIRSLILRSCEIKIGVVEKDTFESAYRKVLNYGHTIGHGIEACEEYQISHGEAVIIGVLVETYLSSKVCGLKDQDLKRVQNLIREYSFPMKLSKNTTKEKMKKALLFDKKSKDKQPHFVLLKEIGKVHPFENHYSTKVDHQLIDESIDFMHANVKGLS